MTAWQDQPPVSRRQVRQTERGDTVDTQGSPAQNPDEQPPFGGFPREGWDADARRAATSQQSADSRPDAAIASGRRVQQALPQSASQPDGGGTAPEPINQEPLNAEPLNAEPLNAEPLNYSTHARPRVPSYEASSFRSRSVAAVPEQPQVPPTGEFDIQRLAADSPSSAQQTYRVRDFSPEGRRSSFSAANPPSNWAPSAAPQQGAGELDYHTQAGHAPDAPLDVSVPEVAAPVDNLSSPALDTDSLDDDEPVMQYTRTRRELRALGLGGFALATDEPEHDVEGASAVPVEAQLALPVDVPPVVEALAERPRFRDRIREPAVESQLDQSYALTGALAEFEVVTAPVEDGAESEAPIIAELEPEEESAAVGAIAVPGFEQLLFPTHTPAQVPAESFSERIEPEPLVEPVANFLNPFDSFLREPETPPTYAPPVGHWSTQASIDDDEQVHESTFSRDIAATSGAITTSALVLPSIPTVDDIMSPLSGTGEILITGSISLPSSMGTTGVHPARYDHSDVDTLLAADDREDSEPDSAPVRAIRAISTNTASGDVINSMKPRHNSRLPMILTIAAAAMAVGVVVLLVAGMIFGIFK